MTMWFDEMGREELDVKIGEMVVDVQTVTPTLLQTEEKALMAALTLSPQPLERLDSILVELLQMDFRSAGLVCELEMY